MKSSLLSVLSFCASSALGACAFHFSSSGGMSLHAGAQREETRALELSAGETLTLDTGFGDAEVVAVEGAQPEIHATLHANGRTREEAEAVLARYQLAIERGPHGPEVRLVGEPLEIRDGGMSMTLAATADFHAVVPPGTRLVATSGSGDLVTRGALGACRLETGYGDVTIEEARGGLFAKSGSGDVSARRVAGERVELASGYGEVQLGTVQAQRVTCHSGSGDVSLESGTAETLELETNYGSVHVRAASGALKARSGSGDVHLLGVNGAIDAESNYGTVEIDGVLSALRAASGSGDVRARAREGSRLTDGWTLSSNYGEVTLRVPEGFACALDARTAYGNVTCDFPITIEAGKKAGDQKLKGTIGAGGASVTISSQSGDVALKKL